MQVILRFPQRGLWGAVLLALAAGAAGWRPAQAQPVADTCPNCAAGAGQIVHTVQPGENLFRIGLHYGVSWIDILQANQLSGSTIYPGQQLIIPLNEPAPAPAPPPDPPPAETPEETPSATPPAASTTYVVQRGDILARIAQRFGVTVSAIAAASNIANPSLIYAGQTLVIPAPGASPPPGSGAPVPSGGSKEIQVDISEQRMYVYQDGNLLWDWVVSTGEPGRDTRPGSFSVLNKIPNAYGSTWDLWMPNWL
ncbi:MAG: LysM peptidoglycan-binding domain-containing protein, partial [Anaerolineales bacterium]|nr:LysM peptidoglycan-binding domain-containing protein [Anaerolineales bacterium]